ncbi:MAG: HAMP domain-containing protein [Myxococcales bacterium]|nr:HAMP domain-containing protein [Myxococcales bacterium]
MTARHEPMKRSLGRKVRALGVLQVSLLAGIMLLIGVLFFAKLLADQAAFEQGTRMVKRGEVEGLAKLLALELGRSDALRYARVGQRSDPAVRAALSEVRSSLWEKVTFIPEVEGIDLIVKGPDGKPSMCVRPMGTNDGCDGIPELDKIMAEYDKVVRLRSIAPRTYVMPLYVAGASFGVLRLQVSDSTAQFVIGELAHRAEGDMVTYVVVFVVCLATASLLVVIALASFFRRMHRPLIALTERAVAIGERPDAPTSAIDADPEDEVGLLVRRFDEMQARLAETFDSLQRAVEQKERAILEREAKDVALRRSERLASVGVLAAGVAHEIGNKLNPMGFVVHNLKRRIEKGGTPDPAQLGLLERNIEDCTTILDKLRSMAKPKGDEREPVQMNAVIDDVALMLGSQTQSRGIALETRVAADLPPILGVRSELVQVIINLVLNARDAIDSRPAGSPPGRIALTAERNQDRVVVEVSDNGVGMTPEVKARLFEPFFTTKGLVSATTTGVVPTAPARAGNDAPSGGSGLGLYLCYGILARHGVEPEIISAPGEGTRFVMSFARA